MGYEEMTYPEIKEKYPRNRTLIGTFSNVDEFDCNYDYIVLDMGDEDVFFHNTSNYCIPVIYYNDDDCLFHHIFFVFRPVVGYMVGSNENHYSLLLEDMETMNTYESYFPHDDDQDEYGYCIIVSITRAFEDYAAAVKQYMVDKMGYKRENIILSISQLKEFLEN